MRRRRDFDTAFRTGRRTGRRLLGVRLAVPDAGTDAAGRSGPPLVGFTVSRRVGNAPTRNRVRRRLRHLARDRLETLPAGAQLVVSANPAAAWASYAELSDELDALLRCLLSRPEEARRR